MESRMDSRCGRSLSRKPEKAALCFFSSWFAKKPFRIQGLLMVMTGVLLVFVVVKRRLCRQGVRPNETLSNHIHQPTHLLTVR
jgi:hypothetical protein